MPARVVKVDFTEGASSQADWRRQEGQNTVVMNCEPDPIYGLLDRNGTDFVGEIQGGGDVGYLTFQFRQFIVRLREGAILVEDDSGNPITVNDVSYSAFSYLDGAIPKSDIDVVIVGDLIFIVNKNTVVTASASADYIIRAQVIDFGKLIDSALSPAPALNDVYQCLISVNATPAGYYKFLGGDHTLGQNWERIAAPNDPNAVLDSATMPHILEYDTDLGQFNFGANQDWGQRLSGVEQSNPLPGFVGHTINTIGYLQGRLIIVGGNAIVSDQGGGRDIFSFWIDDVQRTTATDPLNIDNNFPEMGVPVRCAVIGNDLLIACTQGQMVLTGGQDRISNTNGTLRKLTSWPTREVPIASNGQLCVVSDQNNFLHAYTYQSYVTGTQYLGKLNEHEQSLLQATVAEDKVIRRLYLLADRLFVTSDRDLVVVRFRFDGSQFTQLALHSWKFTEGRDQVIYCDQWVDKIRIMTVDTVTDQFRLIKYYPNIEQPLPGWDYAPALDYRERLTSTTFLPDTNETPFTLSGPIPTVDNCWMVSKKSGVTTNVKPTRISGQTVFFHGDYRNEQVYIGFGYTSSCELTKLYVTPGDVIVKLKEIQIAAYNSATIRLKYGRQYGQQYIKEFGPQFINGTRLDQSVIQTKIYKMVAAGDARSSKIVIERIGPGRMIVSALTYVIEAMTPGNKFQV